LKKWKAAAVKKEYWFTRYFTNSRDDGLRLLLPRHYNDFVRWLNDKSR
jgi:hypothetical protein